MVSVAVLMPCLDYFVSACNIMIPIYDPHFYSVDVINKVFIWAEAQLFLDPVSKHPISETKLTVLITCMKPKGEPTTMEH